MSIAMTNGSGPPDPAPTALSDGRLATLGGEPPQVEGFDRLEELGRGAMTVVYRVRRSATTGPDYAMKMLREPPPDPAAATLAFRREAALLACAATPALATIHDVGVVEDHPYLVMEFVEGRSLAQLLADQGSDDGRLHEQQIVAIARDAAEALASVHDSGLVHRDVKPQNLLVTAAGRTRLIDLSLAMWVRDDGPGDRVAGTFRYSAPEQTGMLARPVDARSDLYALGVVLFECAAGRPPFAADDVGELLHLHAAAASPDLAELRPDLSSTLVRMVAKLLAKDPDDRYQSAAGLVADLHALALDPAVELPLLDRTAPAPTGVRDRLVGRDREVARLVERWQRTRRGRGGVAMVRGAAGAGRGRLAAMFTADVAGSGGLVLSARCTPGDLVPASCFRQAVDRHLAEINELPPVQRSEALARVRLAAEPAAGLLVGLAPRLQALLGTVAGPAGDRQEQFATAAAEFLRELARLAGGLLLTVEDVRWLDPTARRILHHLVQDLGRTPLLVLLTAESDTAGADESVGLVRADVRPALDLDLRLGPLSEAEVAELTSIRLGGGTPPEDLVLHLLSRSGGNPQVVVEYVRALVEGGALRPSWGNWVLIPGAFDAVHLPTDVIDLIVSRLDDLDPVAREWLVAGAVQGNLFELSIVSTVIRRPMRELVGVVAEATRRRIVVPRGQERFEFVHDAVPAALLAGAEPEVVADLHHRVAEALDSDQAPDERTYDVARHRIAAGRERAPKATYEVCLKAARLLLAQHVPADAVPYFEEVHATAALLGEQVASDVHRDHATALLRIGALPAARSHLELALAGQSDRLERVRLYDLLARVELADSDTREALALARSGMQELGRLWPKWRLLQVLVAVARCLTGLIAGWRPGKRMVKREAWYAVEASLLHLASDAAAQGLDEPMMATYLVRASHAANRLGPSPARIAVIGRFGMVAGVAGAARFASRRFDQAQREAEVLGDPALVADVEQQRALVRTMTSGSAQPLLDFSRRHGRWLSVGDHVRVLTFAASLLQSNGNAKEAQATARLATTLVGPGTGSLALTPTLCRISAGALLGEADAAARQLETVRAQVSVPDAPLEHRQYTAWSGMLVAVERGDGTDHLDGAVVELEAAGIPSTASLAAWSSAFVALGRLAQAQEAAGSERRERLDQARRALRTVRRAGDRFNLRAVWMLAHAWDAALCGRRRTAWRRLGRADRAIRQIDAPRLAYEMFRLRARLLRDEGQEAGASRDARIAIGIAQACGWPHRARWLREEFDVGDLASITPSVHSRSGTSTRGTETLLRRRLEALQQVSAATASVVEPDALIRVVLDMTLRILPAERAFLFLAGTGERSGELRPARGRTADGETFTEMTDHSATLVRRVCDTHEALVVTGTQEGAALGSESAVVHGLRSILIAPLLLKGRLVGVLYLDSRVAKGIFAPDDAGLLTAIANQLAASLETARAAQLEVAVLTARKQRDLAEQLRESMTELSGTLEPDQVLRRLQGIVSAVLPGEHGCLLRVDGGRLFTEDGTAYDVAKHEALEHVLRNTDPAVGGDDRILPPPLPDGLATALGHPRSWLAVPLLARGEPIAVVVVGADEVGAYGDADRDIAAAFAGQAIVAYDNADLFSQVQRLATTDMLTGLHNREHFWELAGKQVAASARHDRPLSAIMLDIDHFKAVNDTYGHAVGDGVLREVAERLRETVRTSDLVGRYGGEEFAIALPDSWDAAVLAERLRAVVAATAVETDAGPIPITISVGVADLRGGDSLETLLHRADEALYAAKAAGRDRVVVA